MKIEPAYFGLTGFRNGDLSDSFTIAGFNLTGWSLRMQIRRPLGDLTDLLFDLPSTTTVNGLGVRLISASATESKFEYFVPRATVLSVCDAKLLPNSEDFTVDYDILISKGLESYPLVYGSMTIIAGQTR